MSNRTKRLKNELMRLRLPELQARFQEVTGEGSRSPNRKFLTRRILEVLMAEPATATADEVEVGAAAEPPVDGDDEAIAEDEVSDEPAMSDAETSTESPPVPLVESTESSVIEATASEAEPSTAEASADAEASEPVDDDADTSESTTTPPRQRGRFASMTIEELQAKYLDVVGRATGSDDRRYLVWKIREAEKGRIPVGPRRARTTSSEPVDMKILPLRLEADAVEQMDAAWRSRGLKSRMEFFRRALGHYLAHLGAAEAAATFERTGAVGG
jgi:hypothetical protein